ncbi:MAG: metallophosphoesterase [Verrucomicrobiae bacterium]|nr:metallophosphoesterase [Verrucomicrobiae bacterium]NNJ44049.1 hypothetical protein [Akkermansiaceae bacterium]
MNNHIKSLVAFAVLALVTGSAHAETFNLVPTTATWNYFHPTDGTDPAIADPDFNTTWYKQNDAGNSYNGPTFTGSGSGLFGYGGIGLGGVTVNIGTPASGNRYTAYFTTTFDLGSTPASSITILTTDVLADDGAFIYINGQLATGVNVGGISDTYLATTGPSGNEGSLTTIALDESLLIDGVNTIAVSLHNTSNGSSDLGFQLELTGSDAVPVTLASETSSGWAYLQSLDGSNNDTNPALTDFNFDDSWLDQSIGTYTGSAVYDGPAFTTGATAPFSYGSVSGISGGTILTTPTISTRHTAWFIKEVDGGVDGYSNLTLNLLANDGAFVYLNGHLIANKNMPTGSADTWNLLSTSEGDGDFSKQTILNDAVLKPGPNLLAVSVHQDSITSPNLGVKLKLTGDIGLPDLAFVVAEDITDTTASIYWVTGTAGNSTVRFGTAPGVYTSTVNDSGSKTSHQVGLTGLTADTTYYFEVKTSDGGSFNPTGTGSFTTAPDPSGTLTRGPYLQSASHDRITFRWETSEPGDATVNYGTTQGSLTSSVTVPGSFTDHTVTLTGLVADTRYYYQVETVTAGGNVSTPETADYFFETSPTPGEAHPTRIWVIGDSGKGGAASVYSAFRNYNGDHTDVWLMLGDNAYNSGTYAQFQSAVFDRFPELLRNTTLWSTFGNHDAFTAGGAPYFDLFHFPTGGECGGVASGSENYYSFDYGNIHFVCLDSTTSVNYSDTLGDGGMADWLQSDLEATTADWIIAYFHHGPYTKGSHNSDTEVYHIAMRANTLGILEDYGVDLILSGHSHSYERSHLLNGHHGLSTSYAAATHAIDAGNGSEVGSIDASGNFVLSGADGAYQKPLAAGNAGQVSSIVGASGQLSNWQGGSSAVVNPTPHPVFTANLRVLGSMVIDVDANTLHAVYLDNAGNVRDDFTIVKGTTIEVTATDNSLAEHGADNTATFTLTRSGATSFAEDVNYQISGSATNGGDYSPMLTGSVSFAADETSKQLTVTRVADSLAEGAETMEVTVTGAQQAAGTDGALRDRYFLGTQVMDSATLADKPSQDWWFGQFGATALTNALWKLDTDNDRLDRLQEYALGGSIGTDDSALLPTFQFSENTLELSYSQNNALTDLTFKVFTSTDLSDWTETGVVNLLTGPANPTGVESRKGAVALGAGDSKRFLRLRIDD